MESLTQYKSVIVIKMLTNVFSVFYRYLKYTFRVQHLYNCYDLSHTWKNGWSPGNLLSFGL